MYYFKFKDGRSTVIELQEYDQIMSVMSPSPGIDADPFLTINTTSNRSYTLRYGHKSEARADYDRLMTDKTLFPASQA